jgi:hypothetical protein
MALHGEQLRPIQIERWASFLCDGCSCRVKEANPGVDLLIRADWEEMLETAAEKTPASKAALVAPTIPPGRVARTETTATESGARGCRCWLWGSVSVAALGVVAAGAWWGRSWMGRRGR